MRSRIIILLIVFLCSCKNKESILLKLKYNTGDEHHYVLQQKTLGASTINMNTETEVRFTVDSVIDNGEAYLFYVDLVSIKTDSNIGGTLEHYDSNTSITDMTADALETHKLMNDALKSNYSITISNKGAVVIPFHYLFGGPSDSPVDIGMMQLPFPDKKVNVGYSWTAKRKNPLLSTTNSYTYIIDDITKDNVIVRVEAIIQGLKPITKDTEATGEYIINRKNGNLISGNLEMKLQQGGRVVYTVNARE
jgi:hypothetical protein